MLIRNKTRLRLFTYYLMLHCPFILEAKTTSQLELESFYLKSCSEPSDIYEHMSCLRQLASECSNAVEIGIRSMVSTWGILQGLSESQTEKRFYIGIDLDLPPWDTLQRARELAESQNISFQFWKGNDMVIDIPTTDMLFIDTLHTYCHLTFELEKFCSKALKYIVLHDTSDPWGNCDDSQCYHGDYSEYPSSIDRAKKGLWPAVEDFLRTHPDWKLQARYLNNHGLTVLKRINRPSLEEKIDHAIKNNIILCTGPSLNRKEMLTNHTEKDMESIPFKKIFLSTNDAENLDACFKNQKPVCELLQNQGHLLDCLNCMISTIRNAVNDPDSCDDDIIIFKHESVYIEDMNLVRKAIGKLIEGYEMVARYWTPDHFYMTDVFYMRLSAAKAIFKDLKKVKNFQGDITFCEDYFTQKIASSFSKIYKIDYSHATRKSTELGFYHMPLKGEENWSGYWDKSNYEDLFK